MNLKNDDYCFPGKVVGGPAFHVLKRNIRQFRYSSEPRSKEIWELVDGRRVLLTKFGNEFMVMNVWGLRPEFSGG